MFGRCLNRKYRGQHQRQYQQTDAPGYCAPLKKYFEENLRHHKPESDLNFFRTVEKIRTAKKKLIRKKLYA
jgi:hypothetical protein